MSLFDELEALTDSARFVLQYMRTRFEQPTWTPDDRQAFEYACLEFDRELSPVAHRYRSVDATPAERSAKRRFMTIWKAIQEYATYLDQRPCT
jgi:hypothetical protein